MRLVSTGFLSRRSGPPRPVSQQQVAAVCAALPARRSAVWRTGFLGSTLWLTSALIAAVVFGGGAMAATNSTSLAGAWKLDGAFSSSGETLSMTITEVPGHQWRLALPKDIQPGGTSGDVLLREAGAHMYSTPAGAEVRVHITVGAPGKAQMSISIDNKKGFARFGYGMTRVGR